MIIILYTLTFLFAVASFFNIAYLLFALISAFGGIIMEKIESKKIP